jgi:hypothetical protein
MRRFALILAAVALAGAALAQPSTPRAPTDRMTSVLGQWAFKTEPYREGCVLNGVMTISRGGLGRGFVCKFEASESCPSFRVRTTQTCTVRSSPDMLRMASTLVEVRPSEYWSSYLADNFRLDDVKPTQMKGVLYSGGLEVPVTFRRGDAATS